MKMNLEVTEGSSLLGKIIIKRIGRGQTGLIIDATIQTSVINVIILWWNNTKGELLAETSAISLQSKVVSEGIKEVQCGNQGREVDRQNGKSLGMDRIKKSLTLSFWWSQISRKN